MGDLHPQGSANREACMHPSPVHEGHLWPCSHLWGDSGAVAEPAGHLPQGPGIHPGRQHRMLSGICRAVETLTRLRGAGRSPKGLLRVGTAVGVGA